MISQLSLPLFAIIVSLATRGVHAHGYVQGLLIDGQSYSGYLPFTDPYESPVPQRIVRNIPDDGPVTDISSADLACNTGGESGAPKLANVAAGSTVRFDWTTWPADHLGVVSTYMASCDGDCTTFSTSTAQWFKLDAAGFVDGVWASTKLIDNNSTWTSTIPAALAPGQYLIRNEIIALHSAGAPQFYPSCAQVEVSGSGTQAPSSADLVSIPGIYDDVVFPDIWADSFSAFAAPGPAVAFATGSDDSSVSTPTSTVVSSTSAPSSSPVAVTLIATSSPAVTIASSSPAATIASSSPALSSELSSSATPTQVSTAPTSSSTRTCRKRSTATKRSPTIKRSSKRHASFAKRHH